MAAVSVQGGDGTDSFINAVGIGRIRRPSGEMLGRDAAAMTFVVSVTSLATAADLPITQLGEQRCGAPDVGKAAGRAHITASIGIVRSKGEPDSSEGILHRADLAMYHVKQRGKDGFLMIDEGAG